MLKLQVFLPCEKLIIDKEDMISVINVLDSVTVGQDDQLQLKEDTAFALNWQVFAIWRKTDTEDANKKFEQRIELLRPDGHSVFNATQPLNIDKTHFNFRSILKIGAMPIGQKGILTLKMLIREVGEVDRWQEMGEYFIQVIHKKKVAVKSAKKRIKKRGK